MGSAFFLRKTPFGAVTFRIKFVPVRNGSKPKGVFKKYVPFNGRIFKQALGMIGLTGSTLPDWSRKKSE
jgi:hypothetical protein